MAPPNAISKPQPTNGISRFLQTVKELLVLQALVPATLLAVLSYMWSFVKPRTGRFNPDVDIPDLSGKVILVTGANAGLGKETVLQLAKHRPEKIYLAARNATKAEAAIEDIKAMVPDANIILLSLDLMSFSSIKDAASKFTNENSRLDLLILNAGIMATPFATTEEGYEAQFGTNYIGHALLTKLLLRMMLKTASLSNSDVRIISVSSIGHNMAPPGGIIFDHEQHKAQGPWQLYGQSKLANILHAKALAKTFPQITSVAVHPGMISTNLYTPSMNSAWIMKVGMKMFAPLVFADVKYGSLTQLWAATCSKSAVENGEYYIPVGKKMGASKYAKDEDLAGSLWDWTEEQFQIHGISDSANV